MPLFPWLSERQEPIYNDVILTRKIDHGPSNEEMQWGAPHLKTGERWAISCGGGANGSLLVQKHQQLFVEAVRGFKMRYMADRWNFDESSAGDDLSCFPA